MPRKPSKSSPRKPPPSEMSGLAERLERARTAKGMNKAELARASGMSPDRITRAESGESIDGITAATVVRWARALDVSVGWLLLGEGDVEVLAENDPIVRAAADLVMRKLESRGKRVVVLPEETVAPHKNSK